MRVSVVCADITQLKVDAVIVNLFEGVKSPGGATGAVDAALDGAITRLIEEGEIKGKLNQVSLLHTFGRIEPARVAVVGLGKREDFDLERVRQVSAEACRSLRRAGAKRVASIVHGAGVGGLEPERAAQALAEGALLGLYAFRRHITKEKEEPEIQELLVVERDEGKLPSLERGCQRGRILAEATNLARDMINEPANLMTPTLLAEQAQEVAQAWSLECQVLGREEMQELGMGALLGVSQGSHQPPRLIILRYRGQRAETKPPLGFLGKGVTFDSGGISIKPAQGMGEMKGDMAGGAVVIAALRALGELRPQIDVTGIIPATENLPGGAALKPGDVLRAMNGKSIEVINTDAEGRLILADALCYARKLGLSPLVDVATLTGACAVALGPICSGAFTNNQAFQKKVVKAGEEAGERLWPMPMYEEYKEMIKGDVADIKNAAGREGGAITAAQFLAEFVEDTPWVHLDIAGTSFTDKEKTYKPKGATGVGVRTLVNLALKRAEEAN